MAKKLFIGESGGTPFSLPPELQTQASAIFGVRESGKTNTGVVIVEELLDHAQQAVIMDPTNAWHGLKSSADGRSTGFPIIVIGGPQGDLPLHEGDGATLADFVVESRASVILSMRHLRQAAMRRFALAFTEQLYHRKGDPRYQDPMLTVIDEASLLIPQKVGAAEAQLVGAVQMLARQGRSSGIGLLLIDQRPASVNKDALSQIELLVTHRLTAPQDRKAVREWAEQKAEPAQVKEFLAGLASLKQGRAWFWSPLLDLFQQVHVRKRFTFDSSKTPRPGEQAVIPKVVAQVDIDALKAKLAVTIEEARANDPKELKKRIAELEAEIEATNIANDEDIGESAEAAERRGYERGYECGYTEAAKVEWRKGFAHAAQIANDSMSNLLEEAKTRLARVSDVLTIPPELTIEPPSETPVFSVPKEFYEVTAVKGEPAPESRRVTDVLQRALIPSGKFEPVRPKPSRDANVGAGESLPKGHQRILDALAALEAVGITEPTRAIVGAASGFSYKGGTFQKYVGALSSGGLVHYPSDNRVALTDAGRASAAQPDRPLRLRDLHQAFLSFFELGPRKILEQLIAAFPESISRKELGERTGYASGGGTFQKYVGKLSSFGAAIYPEDGQVRAADLLFPRGLR